MVGELASYNTNRSVKFCNFAKLYLVSFQQITFKLDIFTNFETLFLAVLTDYR